MLRQPARRASLRFEGLHDLRGATANLPDDPDFACGVVIHFVLHVFALLFSLFSVYIIA